VAEPTAPVGPKTMILRGGILGLMGREIDGKGWYIKKGSLYSVEAGLVDGGYKSTVGGSLLVSGDSGITVDLLKSVTLVCC
jgi:hypothetical protein